MNINVSLKHVINSLFVILITKFHPYNCFVQFPILVTKKFVSINIIPLDVLFIIRLEIISQNQFTVSVHLININHQLSLQNFFDLH